MKKLMLAAAVAVSSVSFAQTFGLKAGLNISSISKDTWEDSKSKTGFNAGIFMNAPIATNFSIQPELLYSQYGAKVTTQVTGGTNTDKLSLDYITIPVMFQYNATPAFYLEAGPEFGFMVGAKEKGEYVGTLGNSSIDYNVKDNMNTFNFGIGIGLGYYFTPQFGANARYVAGLNDITNNDKWGNSANNKNGLFQIGLNYKFK